MKKSDKKNGALQLAKAFSDFMTAGEGRLSEYTLNGYRTAVRSFADFASDRLGAGMDNFDISFFTESNVNRYLEWLRDRHDDAAKTCNQRLCQLRAFLKYASRDPEVMPYYLAVRQIPRFITEKKSHAVDPLEKKVIEALMKAPGVDTLLGLRYSTMMALLYTMALRIGELLSAKMKDIDLQGPHPSITVVGKGRKVRTLYIMSGPLKLLKKYISAAHGKNPHPDAYLFYSKSGGFFCMSSARGVNKQLDKYAAKARQTCPDVPEHIHSHQFRHSIATHLLEDDMNVFQISKMLGHKSVETTMAYLGVTAAMTNSAIKKVESEAARAVRPVWKNNLGKLHDLF